VTWIDGTGYVVSPLDGVNGVRRNLLARIMTLVGAIMAPRWTYIEPSIAFNATISFEVVIMALLGGAQRLWGPALGAIPLTLLFEFLAARFPAASTLIMGVISGILLFIHHLHLLLYVPTIGLIVLLRTLADSRVDRRAVLLAGTVASVAIGVCFYFLAFHGSVPVPVDQFTAALRARAIDSPEKIGGYLVQIFYTDIAHEIEETMKGLPNNALRFPVYAILIFLHLPLISYFRRLTLSLQRRQDRLMVVAGLVGVTLGYVIIGVFVFDYPRWVSNWAVCMILIMHAVRSLPSTLSDPVPIDPTLSKNRRFGWILALIPRVGINKPF